MDIEMLARLERLGLACQRGSGWTPEHVVFCERAICQAAADICGLTAGNLRWVASMVEDECSGHPRKYAVALRKLAEMLEDGDE